MLFFVVVAVDIDGGSSSSTLVRFGALSLVKVEEQAMRSELLLLLLSFCAVADTQQRERAAPKITGKTKTCAPSREPSVA